MDNRQSTNSENRALNTEYNETDNEPNLPPVFTILNFVINAALQQITVDQALLEALSSTSCRVKLRGFPTIDIAFQQSDILLLPTRESRDISLLIETDLETLKNLAGTGYAPPGKLKMSGDMGIAQNIQKLAKSVDIDWEGILANFVGNIPAYLLTKQGKKFSQWGQGVGNAKAESVVEYLLYEKQILVSQPEWKKLRLETDLLLDRVERAHAKTALLKTQL